MCGRFTLHASPEAIQAFLKLAEVPVASPRYNIAPTQDVLAARLHDGRRLATPHRWGLVPSWAKGG